MFHNGRLESVNGEETDFKNKGGKRDFLKGRRHSKKRNDFHRKPPYLLVCLLSSLIMTL